MNSSIQPVNRQLDLVVSPAPAHIPITSSTVPATRKIAPSLALVSNNFYHRKISHDQKLLAIHESLHKSGILFTTSVYCFLHNLNDQKQQPTVEKINLFASFYTEQLFTMLPFTGELELSRDEFELVLTLFEDFYSDYNFITLSSLTIKNKGKLQQGIADWFKSTRGVVMESNRDFAREILSAALNDWYSHLQR
ncbi:hypothetical protein I9W82_004487 [Candida metapsilosis]|uniref:Uncharacterized protein n=1 Tax=Candida metapsilosis TaxID=273372 RepID=A0A8H7ZFP3_9ASCO|nr:hypothetical protein I9W82_004487 [Candida metapsilosis]